jgi:hypothetical protein
VTVRVHDGDDTRRFRGVLTEAGPDSCVVQDDDGVGHEVVYAHVERARTVFEWGPPPRPSKKKAVKP